MRLLLALVATVAAGRDYPQPAPVVAVTTHEATVVYALALRRRCTEVRAWEDDRSDMRIARHCFAATSTGSGVAAVEHAWGRTLYLTYTGGNVREWTLWTQAGWTRAGPIAPRRIAAEAADVDGPPPFILARRTAGPLAYAAGSRIVVIDDRGKRLFSYDARARIVDLSVQVFGVAAVTADGTVLAFETDGSVIAERSFAAGDAQAAEMTADGLLVYARSRLEVGGRTYELPQQARWLGFRRGVFAYGVGSKLYIGRTSDGKRAFVRPFGLGHWGRVILATSYGKTLTRQSSYAVEWDNLGPP